MNINTIGPQQRDGHKILVTEPRSGRARRDLQDSLAQWVSEFTTQKQYICHAPYKANKKQLPFTLGVRRPEGLAR